ncbi:MAG: hypothetical protein HUJ56_13570, partial [Erysipelotrichaceae bacterium]|nr:hypothetical protein [Erysipelotrichaceae bacterium]
MRKLLGSLLTLIFIINSGITILLPLVAQENTMSQGLSDFTVSVIADQQDAISLGEDVTYTIRVINTGKVKVTDVTVVDSSTTLTKVDDWSSFDLAVGEEKVLTGTHTITQADIEAGEVEASISVSGRYEKDYVVYHETKLKVYPEHPHPDLALTVVADKDNKV